MNKLTGFVIFIAGAAIGSSTTWYYTKKYYEKIAQEEIDDVKAKFSYKVPSEEPKEKKEDSQDQKAVAEPPALHPPGDVPLPGQAEAPSQQGEELAPAAVAVAVALGPPHQGDDQGDEKAQQAQPGEEDVEKAQGQVAKGEDPEIVEPFLLHTAASRITITEAGHSLAHFPQPTHRLSSTSARRPL